MLFFALVITAATLILNSRARGKELVKFVKLNYCLKVVPIGLILILLMLGARLNYAQPSSAAVYRQAADITGIIAKSARGTDRPIAINFGPAD